MRIRCPHCYNPIQVVDGDPLTEIDCTSCGSRFSLLSSDTASWPQSATRRIAQFELIEQVGMGHFGSVWKSRDVTLDRVVAIKIPRHEQLDPVHLEQFLREARAAAQLRHPNIVQVHEVGKSDGSIYIVSDFIAGCSLKEWLGGQRLSTREAAQVCAKVAVALQHAHERGVIHRDLKPGNIMLDQAGEPHLMDFGLARRETGEVTMTVDGRILGTPAYMSPEQARGEAHLADRRSDIYSLGVILFELLTGELPFRGETRMLVVQILRDEPPSPRRLNSHVPRDLETICLKCLQKNPGRRYQTAAELADDLGRWLDNRPIQARPVGRAERLVRWAQREPRLAVLTAAIVLITILGFAGVTWQWRKAVVATDAAQQNLEDKETQRQRREINFNRAMTAVDRMLMHVGAEELAQIPDVAPVRKAILEDAWKLYKELLAEKSEDRQLQYETALAALRVATIRSWLRENRDAIEAYDKAVAALMPIHATEPDNHDVALALTKSCLGVAAVLRAESNYAKAMERLDTAEEVIRNTETLRSSPANLLHVLFEKASCLTVQSKLAEAEKYYREVIDIGEAEIAKLDKDMPDPRELVRYAFPTAAAYRYLHGTLVSLKPELTDEIENAHLRAIALYEQIAGTGKTAVFQTDFGLWFPYLEQRTWDIQDDIASTCEQHATWLQGQGRGEDAELFLAKAEQVRQKLIDNLEQRSTEKTRDAVNQHLLAFASVHQARLLKRQNKIEEAIAQYRKALETYQGLAKSHPRISRFAEAEVQTAIDLAVLLISDAEAWRDGYALLDQVHEHAEALGLNVPSYQSLDARLFQTLRDKYLAERNGKGIGNGEPLLLEAVKLADRMLARSPDDTQSLEAVSFSYHQLGDLVSFAKNQPAAAAEHYERSRLVQETMLSGKSLSRNSAMNLGWTCQNGGRALFAKERGSLAFAVAVRGVEMREYLVSTYPREMNFQTWLEDSYKLLARHVAHCSNLKDEDLQKAISIAQQRVSSDPEYGWAWRTLGIALVRCNRPEEAIEALQKASLSELPDPAYESFFLAQAFLATGDSTAAKRSFDEGAASLATYQGNRGLLPQLQSEVAQMLESSSTTD